MHAPPEDPPGPEPPPAAPTPLREPELAAQRRTTLFAAAVAVVLTALYFALVGRVNFNPTEEGYLWYGTLRTAAGEVPIRDFQSYDPGRYYWCAWLGELFGHGVIGLRVSVACFQALGMCLGLLAARRVLASDWGLVPVGLLFLAWMFPRHKIFESALSLSSVFFAVRLLEAPTTRRHFEAGLMAGLAGVFGRNHAVYCVLGMLVLGAALAWRQRRAGALAPSAPRRLGAFSGGVVAGYSPILLMLAFVPGFPAAFWNSILILLKLGANIPHPWPWPWTYPWSGGLFGGLEDAGKAFWFTVPFVVFPLGLVTLFRTSPEAFRRRALFLAGSTLGLFYIHHASVRSDASHIAQSIDPLLLAVVGLPAAFSWRLGRARFVLWSLVGLLTLGSTLATHQLLSRARLAQRSQLVEHAIGDDRLLMMPGLARYYEAVEQAVRGNVPEGEGIFFAPSRPGFYAIFGRVSPTWWIYFFVPELDAETQNEVIASLEAIDWVFLIDDPIAGQERFLFRNTSDLVWDHLRREFERVPTPALPPDHYLLRRK